MCQGSSCFGMGGVASPLGRGEGTDVMCLTGPVTAASVPILGVDLAGTEKIV